MIKVLKYIYIEGVKPATFFTLVFLGIASFILVLFSPPIGICFLVENYSGWFALLFIPYAVVIPIVGKLLGITSK